MTSQNHDSTSKNGRKGSGKDSRKSGGRSRRRRAENSKESATPAVGDATTGLPDGGAPQDVPPRDADWMAIQTAEAIGRASRLLENAREDADEVSQLIRLARWKRGLQTSSLARQKYSITLYKRKNALRVYNTIELTMEEVVRTLEDAVPDHRRGKPVHRLTLPKALGVALDDADAETRTRTTLAYAEYVHNSLAAWMPELIGKLEATDYHPREDPYTG